MDVVDTMELEYNREINIEYINLIRDIFASPDLLEANRINIGDFTRTRKLPFETTIAMILNKPLHTLNTRVNMSFQDLCQVPPTPSAFFQARKKVNPNVFVDILNNSNYYFYKKCGKYYENKKWKGHNVLAVDGSRFTVPATEETEDVFTRVRSRNQKEGVLQANTVTLYDSLNKLPLVATFGKLEAEKNPVFRDILPFMETSPISQFLNDPIYIFDRLYTDFTVFSTLVQKNIKFCIRAKTAATFNIIKDFLKSNGSDSILEFNCPYSARKKVRLNNLPEVIKLRAIKVELDSGEIEVLITNLFDQEIYPASCFKELYFYRWGIETAFGIMKTFIEIEIFSSDKLQFIYQEFYSRVFLYAYVEMIKKIEDRKAYQISIERKRKYIYQVGIAELITAVNNNIINLFLKTVSCVKTIYNRISNWLKSNLSPIRPNRKIKRNKSSDSKKLVFHTIKKRQHS